MRKFLIKKMTLFLTEECDKTCTYCDIPFIKNKKGLDKKILEEYLPIIDKSDSFYHYTITGGEPGLIDEESFDYIFETIQCHPIRINTNGKFIETGYYEKYKDKIWQIGIHVDINEDIKFEIVDPSVWYYVPVNKKNYTSLFDLIQQYPKLNFSVIPYIHKNSSIPIDEYSLNLDEYIKIYNSIKSFNNVASCTKEMIDLIKKNNDSIETFKKACKYNFVQPMINFTDGSIGRCAYSHSQNKYVPLTQKSLNELFTGKLDFGSLDTSCEKCVECFRYFDYYMNNLIVKNCM